MKIRQVFLSLFMGILLTTCSDQAGQSNWSEPEFNITSSQPEDIITIASTDESSVIDVNSPGGIGSAQFELVSGTPPKRFGIRLHLKGLEKFRLQYEETVISASVSSGSPININQQVWLSDIEQTISPSHPLWMEIKIFTNETTLNIPLKDGYFEISFPKEFAEKSANSFEIQWVDFFRQ